MLAALLLLAQPEPVIDDAIGTIDVEAYFPKGPFRAAQQAIGSGNVEHGVRMLRQALEERPDAKERPQARYLLGLGLMRLGEYEEAAQLFDELASSYPVLADDHLFFRGQALYLWGSYLDAAEVLSRVPADGPRAAEAKRLRAWSLLRATDFSRLVRWLEADQAQRKLEPELAYVLAEARHRTGDILGAFRGFREVWREDDGAFVGLALLQIAKLRIGDRHMLKEEERRVILGLESRLSTRGDADPSLAELDRRLARSTDAKLRAEVSYARGRYAEARKRFKAAEAHYRDANRIAPAGGVELRARVALALGRVLEWLGKEAEALETYRGIADRFADRPESEDALIAAAEIEVRGRNYEGALHLCEQLLLANPVTAYRRRCLWAVGWAHFRLGQYDRAGQFLGSLERMDLSVEMDGASKYWLARTLATLGKSGEASAMYQDIIRRYPLSYYSALSEDQLTERIDPARGGAESKRPEELPAAVLAATEYVRLGLAARAITALVQLERSEKSKSGKMREDVYHAIARLYEELRQPLEARRIREECARAYPTSLGDEAFVEAARKAHPLKYEDLIRKYADEFQIPESLLLGLIRTESGFRPNAVSNMNAYGLAQLILPTAQSVASRIRAGRATRDRLLYDPAFNIRLGAAYVRQLLDHFGGSEVLALAAYNAGPAAVDAWLSRRVRALEGVKGRGVGVQPAPDELAEEIPVEETRKFVKVVLARARGYGRLYARPAEVEAAEPVAEIAAAFEPTDLPARPRRTPAVRGTSVVGREYVRSVLESVYDRPLLP